MYFRRVDHGADRAARHPSPRQLAQCTGLQRRRTTTGRPGGSAIWRACDQDDSDEMRSVAGRSCGERGWPGAGGSPGFRVGSGGTDRVPTVLEEFECGIEGLRGIVPAGIKGSGLQNEVRECPAAEVIGWRGSLLGDGAGYRLLVAYPHPPVIVAQRRIALDEAHECFELGAAGGVGENTTSDVVSQRVQDGLPGRALPDRGDKGGLPVGLLVEDQRFLAGKVLEQGGGRYVGRLSDVLDADLFIAVLEEQAQCCIG